MPENLMDADTGGTSLVFADEMSGVRYRLTEAALYSAEEVRDDLGNDETPEYGRWAPVTIEGEECWLLAPGELIDELQRLEAASGEVFEVTRCQKSGSDDTDPWEVNLERLSDDDQTRF